MLPKQLGNSPMPKEKCTVYQEVIPFRYILLQSRSAFAEIGHSTGPYIKLRTTSTTYDGLNCILGFTVHKDSGLSCPHALILLHRANLKALL